MQNSAIEYIFQLRLQPAEHASDAKELRAFAAPKLRPADLFEVEYTA